MLKIKSNKGFQSNLGISEGKMKIFQSVLKNGLISNKIGKKNSIIWGRGDGVKPDM